MHLALLVAGIGPGDEVITVPFTFVATVAAIQYAGARPVLVDIDPRSLSMAVDQIEPAITPRTKAILPVHLYGCPADMDPILEIARRHGLMVIEDAAQAHGAEYKGRRAGGIGDLGCFSFYPGKNLGAYGEGGLVTTNRPDYDRTLRMLRDWGAERKYHHELKGFNYRMEGLQGAILRVKLRHLETWTEARRAHAARYDDSSRAPGSRRRHACPTLATSTTSTPCATRDATFCKPSLAIEAFRRASTTRSRYTYKRLMPTWVTRPATSPIRNGPPTKSCRCRCFRNCPRLSSRTCARRSAK